MLTINSSRRASSDSSAMAPESTCLIASSALYMSIQAATFFPMRVFGAYPAIQRSSNKKISFYGLENIPAIEEVGPVTGPARHRILEVRPSLPLHRLMRFVQEGK